MRFLVEENIGLIDQGVDLVVSLDPDVYRRNAHEHFTSGVGRHFRHVLDFYERMLMGRGSVVDYESRRRDERIEVDPDYATRAARTICGALGEIDASSPVRIRTECRDGDGISVEADSTVERELAMLASHTIHHYAIIALILRIQDVSVPEEFGVAPSTLRYVASRES